MIGGGLGAPGQRGIEKGGRDQDLLTPFWQTVALCVFGAWVLAWLVALALILGPILGYSVSAAILYGRWMWVRKRVTVIPWTWLAVALLVHVGVAYGAERIWTTYIMDWSPWLKLLSSLLCLLMMAPAAWLYYHIAIRIADPHYPSPRKAVEQRQPQMPWYMDDMEVQEVSDPQAQLVTLEIVEGATRRYLTDIELTAELQSFCRRVMAKTITFSEGGADSCDWPKPAFADLRDQMVERKFIEWKNAENTRSGYYFHPIAWRALEELAELPLPHSHEG